MRFVKKVAMYILIAVLVLGLLSPVIYVIHCLSYKETLEYNLYEINDGIYGYYNIVSSSIPAQNYEVITLYFGGVYTLKGDVNIHYTNERPRLVWEKTKIVNGDTIDVHVPYNSIEIRPNMTVG